MSKLSEHDFLVLDCVDSAVLPHAETPRIGNARQPPHVALGSTTLRISCQRLKCVGQPVLNVAREGFELLLRTPSEGDRERSQRTTLEVQLFANLTPGTPLLPSQASEVLQEELLWGVDCQKVVDEIVV